MPGDVALDRGDGVGQRDAFGAGLDAILRVRAVHHTAIIYQRLQPVVALRRARRVKVVVMRQRDWSGADKRVAWIDIRANLEAAAAGHTARDGVSFLLDLRKDARPRPQVVRSVNLDPAL